MIPLHRSRLSFSPPPSHNHQRTVCFFSLTAVLDFVLMHSYSLCHTTFFVLFSPQHSPTFRSSLIPILVLSLCVHVNVFLIVLSAALPTPFSSPSIPFRSRFCLKTRAILIHTSTHCSPFQSSSYSRFVVQLLGWILIPALGIDTRV
ncbi:hypothetical protein BDN72DRAFT_492049 [Pluteus cervinus]|uniref:Uncharacterized protein n=1 Tax=Pluteus cervinus TaxID=181527 RepID=A0ACD3AZ34_9AGAR|nr:hypothetical protein BDN72DRAFT_492049 [Pluteus cervinus]